MISNKEVLYKRLIFILSIAGVLLSAYMWYLKVYQVNFKCLISSCETVLASKYSTIFGVPVPTYGFFYYGILVLLSIQDLLRKSEDIIDRYMWIFLLVIGDIFTLYLRWLEFVKLHEWCELCWTSVIILFVINILFFLKYSRTVSNIS